MVIMEERDSKRRKFRTVISNFWFYVGGQCGSGKTHICTSIIIELLKKNRDVYYMPWRDEITKLKSVIFNENKYGSFIYRLKSVEILYIDDFFKTGKNKEPVKNQSSSAFMGAFHLEKNFFQFLKYNIKGHDIRHFFYHIKNYLIFL